MFGSVANDWSLTQVVQEEAATGWLPPAPARLLAQMPSAAATLRALLPGASRSTSDTAGSAISILSLHRPDCPSCPLCRLLPLLYPPTTPHPPLLCDQIRLRFSSPTDNEGGGWQHVRRWPSSTKHVLTLCTYLGHPPPNRALCFVKACPCIAWLGVASQFHNWTPYQTSPYYSYLVCSCLHLSAH